MLSLSTTWLVPLLGGVLIGVSAFLLYAVSGRIAGVSGILRGVLDQDRAWRLAFLGGLLLVGVVAAKVVPSRFDVGDVHSLSFFAVGGLLVGVGTAIGGGCTSGHGVCGMSRLSPRSAVATLVFTVAGAVAVYVVRHVLRLGGGLS